MTENRARPAAKPPRAKGLFVVRESDVYDLEMFNAMRLQTYLAHRHMPEVEAVLSLGLTPLTDADFTVEATDPESGKSSTAHVFSKSLQVGGTTATLFFYGGYWHLWCQSSAAMETAGVNEFTKILIDQIELLRPRKVFAAGISRLIRSQRQGNLLQNAFEGNVDAVVTGEMEFRFAGPVEAVRIGRLAFSMMCQMASWERDWIVQRLLAGRISKWRRREWAFGRAILPFGYELDKKRRLVPRESLRREVREMLGILSMSMPPAETVRQLDAAGVVSTRHHVPYGDLTDPRRVVNSLYSWAPLYCQGEFVFRVRNVFRGFEELNGLTVMRRPAGEQFFDAETTPFPGTYEEDEEEGNDDDGEFQMLYKPGTPDGGWAEPAHLEAFASAAIAHFSAITPIFAPRPLSPEVVTDSVDASLHAAMLSLLRIHGQDSESRELTAPARSRQTISLLSGQTWTDGHAHFELRSQKSGMYDVMRSPLRQPARELTGQATSVEGVAEGSGASAAQDDEDDMLAAQLFASQSGHLL